MMTQVPQPLWEALYRAARGFYKLAPWQWMGDDDVFMLIDPATETPCFLTVMGQMGDYYALAMYRGEDGLKSLLMLQDDADATDPEAALYEQDCLIASFEAEEDADPEDMALAHSLGIDLGDMDRFPGFRSYKRGFMPWVLDEGEVILLTQALEQAIETGLLRKDNPELLQATEEDKGKMYTLRLQEGVWTQSWEVPPRSYSFSPLQLQLDDALVEKIKSIPVKEGIWLFEKFFFRQPSLSESYDRPFFPMAFLLMDMETQTIAGLDLTDPFKVAETGGELLLELFQDAGVRPSQMVVSERDNYMLLQGLGRALGMQVHLEEELDILPDLKAELYRMMEEDEGDDED